MAVALLLLLALPSSRAFAADDLQKVLAKLDEASTKFKSVQGDLVWENVQTQPIEDRDAQAGTVIFERKSGQLQMALHLKTDQGRPIQKDMVYAGGLFKLYEPKIKQMQVFKAGANKAQFDTFLTLGFGGSGKELVKAWEVSYAGSEAVDGHPTSKLQLIPRDEGVRKNFTKVDLWIDMDNGLALKQQSFDPSGNYRIVSYHNLKLNGSVPSDAFDLKTLQGTQIINR
jgi:outer membrane lipoprotein-sorting protein